MKKTFFLFVFSLLLAEFIFSQNERKFSGFQNNSNRLEVFVTDGKYIFQAYNENIIATTFIPNGEQEDTFSYAVVLKPLQNITTLSDNENELWYKTAGLKVKISKSPFKITYFYKNKELIAENKGYIHTDTAEILNFQITNNETLMGGGERVLGMNRRGNRLELYNRAHYGYTTHSSLMNYSMPVVVSSKKYIVHFDNPQKGFLDLDCKHNNELSFESIGGRKVYQIIAGDDWFDLMNQFTNLTGKQALPPRWIFGNFASRFGYHSQKETEETVNKFLQDSIPLDAVIIDIYWFGKTIKGEMGNLDWYTDSFPNPQKMINDFKEKNIKTILVTEPFILTTSKRWDEAVNKKVLCTDTLGAPFRFDFYFGNTGLIDIFKPKSRHWFWNIYKDLVNQGIGGWWGDLGEPEVHPHDLQHINGSADELHNVYGHSWAQLIAEGYKKDFPNVRPFILMRAGAVGSQRYGLIPWSGDVSRSWGGLVPQVEISLQMGLQGIGYMHSDLGGFAGGEHFDSELYIRWLQYGVFQPVFRPHAQEHIAPEPVFHDERTKKMAKQAILLRYALLPYNYTLAYENSTTGIPLMRPLFFIEENNDTLFKIADEYLWGDAFLVAPVTEKGQKSKNIYFPRGYNWFDFFTGKKYEGGKSDSINLVESHIPVFVRAGAFVPLVQAFQNTEVYNTENLQVHYYFDKDVLQTSYTMYDDDGKNPQALSSNKYELLTFAGKYYKNILKINISSNGGNYKGKPETRNINLLIHNLSKRPKFIKFSGKKYKNYVWDKKSKVLNISFAWKDNYREIKLKF
ncbi:MAG: DUF4968 domain-containing protein [Bacteroidales bacterium]|nr:DUF4968 domain-containing protein [Bacteroidales bacterium]